MSKSARMGWAALALGLALVAKAEAQFTIKTVPNLTYATVGTKALLIDLYLPQGATTTTPIVLWIHGGAWSTTTHITKDNIGHITSVLVPKGIAVASLNYRLSEEAKWPAQIQDCKGAVRWLRANAATYNLNGVIGAWGESAGGHLAAILGTAGGVGMYTSGAYTADLEGTVGGNPGVSSRVQAVADYYGPTDFFRSAEGAGHFAWDVTKADFPPNMLIDGFVLQNPDKCKSASSLPFVEPTDPPFAIYHGTADDQVLIEQSKFLDSALKKNNVPSTLTILTGAGHSAAVFWSAVNTKTVYDFFAKYLVPSSIGLVNQSRGRMTRPSVISRSATSAPDYGWGNAHWNSAGRILPQ